MRTIGRKLKTDRRADDFIALCDVCGVPWLHSKLWKDPEGLYRCPTDRDGLDVVTLSKMNAEALSRPLFEGQAYDGNRHDYGDELKTNPFSALPDAKLIGWWDYKHGFYGSSRTARWENSVRGYTRRFDQRSTGDVQSSYEGGVDSYFVVTSSCPLPSDDGVVFNYQAMRSRLGADFIQAGDNPSIWVVGRMVHGELGGSFGALVPVPTPYDTGRVGHETVAFAAGVTAFGNRPFVAASYQSAGQVTVFGPPGDTDLHLYSLRAEPGRLVFGIGNDEYVDDTPSGDSVPRLDTVVLGAYVGEGEGSSSTYGQCTIREMVITRDIPTAAEEADLKAYFLRRHPDLSL